MRHTDPLRAFLEGYEAGYAAALDPAPELSATWAGAPRPERPRHAPQPPEAASDPAALAEAVAGFLGGPAARALAAALAALVPERGQM